MDTSETYIKMCEKAEEIQKIRVESEYWEEGDWLFRSGKVLACGWNAGYFEGWLWPQKGDIWLPRQDDLQEMVKPLELYAFYHWVYRADQRDGDYLPDCNKVYTSMEQLWLAFVMSEKYNKVWNGEEWT